MNASISTISDSLLSMVPAFAVGLLACMAWYLVCRFLMRRQDAAWQAALPLAPEAESVGGYNVQIQTAELRLACLHVQAYAMRRGKPSDRLFAFSLLVASVIAIAGLVFQLAISLD